MGRECLIVLESVLKQKLKWLFLLYGSKSLHEAWVEIPISITKKGSSGYNRYFPMKKHHRTKKTRRLVLQRSRFPPRLVSWKEYTFKRAIVNKLPIAQHKDFKKFRGDLGVRVT